MTLRYNKREKCTTCGESRAVPGTSAFICDWCGAEAHWDKDWRAVHDGPWTEEPEHMCPKCYAATKAAAKQAAKAKAKG